MVEFRGPLAGFGVTLTTMFKKPNTEQYPEQKRPTAPRYHGRHQLNRYPDGLEKCIGCELCAWACPADAIHVEGADNTDEERYSPGERYGRVYQINYLRCIGCGLCISTVPEVFEVNADGKAEAYGHTSEENKAAVQEAIDACPVQAISFDD